MQQENNKCIICLLQIFKYSLQGQRFLFVKCTKKNGACFPKAYYSKFSLCICFFEMVMGMFGSFYFGKEISTFDSSILYKLKCSAFFITTAAIGNATLWNLRINSLKTFLLLLFFACNNYFSLSYDLQRNLKIYYLVQFVTYWFINILWLVVYVITFYITNGNYKALQIPMWTGITFFGSVYYELNAYMKILFIFFDKIVSFGKNLNKKIRFHKYLSMSHGIFIGEILWLRRSYDETIRIVENMTKYLSLMTIFAFALVIPCLISMACSSMQFILCYNCVSKDEIILLTEAIGFALPWILFGAYVLEKIGRLERKVSL